jgi:hypothetical protein
MALTAAKRYSMKQRNPEMINSYPVRSGMTIYYGALVGLDTVNVNAGRLVNWNDNSGMLRFCGVAMPRGTRDLPESVLGNAGGTIVCEVYEGGAILENVDVTNAVAMSLGDPVYCEDEGPTFKLSATPNVGSVGRVSRYISAGKCDVQLWSSMEYAANQNFGKV